MTMSGVKKLKALSAALIVLFLMNSCADFFSTSWGEIFKRDPKNVRVTASNVRDLLDVAKGDPDLARAILDQIDKESDDALKLSAIKAANQAADIPTLALENISDFIDAVNSGEEETAIRRVIEQIERGIQDRDLAGISGKLGNIFADKVSGGFKDALINTGEIILSVPVAGGAAAVRIDLDNTGAGTVTITSPDGVRKSYACRVNDDGTIALLDDSGKEAAVLECVNDGDALYLAGFGAIPGAGLADASAPLGTLASGGKPEFAAGFLNSVPETDLALLVMTLVLAKAEKERNNDGNLNGYLETWNNKNVETGDNLDPEEVLIAALVNVMIDRGDDMSDLTDMIKDLLEVD
jgi:hypothetical protein